MVGAPSSSTGSFSSGNGSSSAPRFFFRVDILLIIRLPTVCFRQIHGQISIVI